MYKSLSRPLLLILVLCGLWPTVLPAATRGNEREAKAAELKQLRERMQILRKELDATRSQHSAAVDQLRDIEQDIGVRVKKIRRLKKQLARQNRRLNKLGKKQQKRQQELVKQRRLLGRQIRAAYIIGRQEYVKLLLNQEDPAAAGRAVIYYDYFNRARSKRIGAVQQTITELTRLEQAIKQEKSKTSRLHQRRLSEKRTLQKSFNTRSRLVARLSSEIKQKDRQLTELVENEKHLQRLLQAIQESMPDILTAKNKQQLFARQRGKLNWPALGKVQLLFGRKRSQTQLSWNGVMISAPEGNNVRAIARGRVVYADWLRGYGLLLILDHGDGYMSLYGHNQSLFREVGEWVEQNEPVASIGNSGGRAKAGLYFEIRHNGKPDNPASWCRQHRRG